MNRPDRYALDATKEITIAAMQSSSEKTPWANGADVAAFFETVYSKIYEIAKREEDQSNS